MSRGDLVEVIVGAALVITGVAMLSIAAACIVAGAGIITYAFLFPAHRGD